MIRTIGIVSLSRGILGEGFMHHELYIGIKRLQDYGVRVKFLPHSLDGLESLAANPEHRAQDLLDAFRDPEIDAILCAIGGGDALVGRGKYCDYPAEVTEIPAVESGSDTNIEQIVELQPQVLLMSTMSQTDEQVQQLEAAGVHVVVSDAQDIEGVYTAIHMIGELVGKQDEAASVVESMQKTFDEIKANAGDGSKTVYFEVSPLQYGLWTAGTGTFMDEIANMMGLKNCFADVTGWSEISEEQVLERNPDYIVSIAGMGDTAVEEIMGRDGWGDIGAVKNGRVYNADSNAISRPGPRLKDAAIELYHFLNDDEAEEAPAA